MLREYYLKMEYQNKLAFMKYVPPKVVKHSYTYGVLIKGRPHLCGII